MRSAPPAPHRPRHFFPTPFADWRLRASSTGDFVSNNKSQVQHSRVARASLAARRFVTVAVAVAFVFDVAVTVVAAFAVVAVAFAAAAVTFVPILEKFFVKFENPRIIHVSDGDVYERKNISSALSTLCKTYAHSLNPIFENTIWFLDTRV